ncbi:hypothetical protein HU200_058614 [Digitaria exilis]|uniref:Uncharacterized protein n=1 Tax=Digitaria exilis TaxID=1010633 RepID=A0A835E3D4_9POAL|nr:hypothetical protein HU200_058614 [Digitaria exilis]
MMAYRQAIINQYNDKGYVEDESEVTDDEECWIDAFTVGEVAPVSVVVAVLVAPWKPAPRRGAIHPCGSWAGALEQQRGEIAEPPTLPTDPLLEIDNVATIICCAAQRPAASPSTSKL